MATAYVEQLEHLGFIGPQKGTAAREIIKSWDDWIEQLKGNGPARESARSLLVLMRTTATPPPMALRHRLPEIGGSDAYGATRAWPVAGAAAAKAVVKNRPLGIAVPKGPEGETVFFDNLPKRMGVLP